MAELIATVTSWPSLLGVLVVFGFAPGFCLRLIVFAYPRGDPRRAELIAELYAVPRIQRPLWVAEQLEVALFEGLVMRARTWNVSRRRRPAAVRGAGRILSLVITVVLAVGGVGGSVLVIVRLGSFEHVLVLLGAFGGGLAAALVLGAVNLLKQLASVFRRG
jgi:hypothetical protein